MCPPALTELVRESANSGWQESQAITKKAEAVPRLEHEASITEKNIPSRLAIADRVPEQETVTNGGTDTDSHANALPHQENIDTLSIQTRCLPLFAFSDKSYLRAQR